MAAPTTIHDLPDDMLHEIFGHVFAAEPAWPALWTHQPPVGAHQALRDVCRRWRDIADWVRLSTSSILVDTSLLADAGAVRARQPAAFKDVTLVMPPVRHSASVSKAAASLINGSADLRRVLAVLRLQTCCLPSLLLAVAPIASCTALVELHLFWVEHESKCVALPSNVLAPLSALSALRTLEYAHPVSGKALPKSTLLAPPPALPDAPRLTCFLMGMAGNFVLVGSDAALGRLRRLTLAHRAPVQELVDAEDPFLLRAAVDKGTWQPSRLTGLQELAMRFGSVHDWHAPLPPTESRPGSEWAPLAGQVTKLTVKVQSIGYRRPSTGIVAGLGVLTALRSLTVAAEIDGLAKLTDPGLLQPVSLDRVRAKHLTLLDFNCASTPASVAGFPNLVHLRIGSLSRQPPLNLRSLVARSSLKDLVLFGHVSLSSGIINLAELFVGSAGWPVLKRLLLHNIALEWDKTGLAGTPTAAEFEVRARQLLPALVVVEIAEPRGRSRGGFVVACRRYVVPALLGLDAGGG